MGSPEDEVGRRENETQHWVTITQGFWLGKYVVTQSQWRAVMGSNPSYFKGENLPIEGEIFGAISRSGGFLEKVNLFAACGGMFALPTEAQWEYACRAGTTTAFNNGTNLTSTEDICRNLDEVGWYSENSGGEIHPVGLKKANAWGLHDMHGNSWEWCAGGHDRSDNANAVTNRSGYIDGSFVVVRGGCWGDGPNDMRCARRSIILLDAVRCGAGFRLAHSSVTNAERENFEAT